MSVTINNLKLNNESVATPVRITDGRPTLTWVFDAEDVVSPSVPAGEIDAITEQVQKAYYVKIGITALNLGADAFSGSIANTSWITSESNFWRYNGLSLTRGTTYYGQVRVEDQYS